MSTTQTDQSGLVKRAARQLQPLFDNEAAGGERARAALKGTGGIAAGLVSAFGIVEGVALADHADPHLIGQAGFDGGMLAIGVGAGVVMTGGVAFTVMNRRRTAVVSRNLGRAGFMVAGATALASAVPELAGASSVAHAGMIAAAITAGSATGLRAMAWATTPPGERKRAATPPALGE